MHGQVQYIAVFAVSLFAALGMGNIVAVWVSDWRRERASRVAIARLNWRGETQDEVEQPGWTDEQIAAYDKRWNDTMLIFKKQSLEHMSLPVEPREQWPPDGLGVSRVAMDGPVTLLGDESEVEQERRLR